MKGIRALSDLSGRRALVTGGAGHVGRAVCEALAEQGADVVVLDLDEAACVAVASEISTKWGMSATGIGCNLEDGAAIEATVAQLESSRGDLSILVHAAAMVASAQLEGWCVPFTEQASGPWRRALEINLTAPFFLTQACVRLLTGAPGASIIFINSIYGLIGPDLSLYEGTSLGNVAAYAASKGGLLQTSRWLATTLAPGIRVNSVTLGGIERGQPKEFQERYCQRTPMKRMGREEDVKGAILYLASDLSNYVTGQNIIVDGGWTAW